MYHISGLTVIPGNPMNTYQKVGQFCYKFHGDALKINRSEITALCAAENAHLSVFRTEEEYEAIKFLLSKCEYFFISASSCPRHSKSIYFLWLNYDGC